MTSRRATASSNRLQLAAAFTCQLSLAALATAPTTVRAQCAEWSPFGSGVNNTTLAVAGLANGDVVAGGVFSQAGGTPVARIARWDGNGWSALGSGLDNSVRAIVQLQNGDLVAGGDFLNAGGAPANRVARWNGSTWSPLGLGLTSTTQSGLYALAVMPNGDLIVGGFFQNAGTVATGAIARWNGSAWSALGPGLAGTVFALAVAPNGDLIVGGNFSTAGGQPASRLARWNGSTWSGFGSGLTGFRVDCIANLPNGDLVVGGAFTAAGGAPAANIARWNGSSWSPLGSGTNGDVRALTVLPNGDLVAGGQFTTAGGVAAAGAARWNGSSWSSLGFANGSQVYAIADRGPDERTVGGFFSTVDGVGAGRVVGLSSSCLPDSSDDGGGCPGSGGANLLSAVSQPWAGATFRSHGSGLPSLCIAAIVTGFDLASVPLAAVLPPSGPTCQLRVTPDLLAFALPSGGALDAAVPLPNDLLLASLSFYQQLVLLELHPVSGAFVDNTASNRLSLTIGAY
jgi:hypothetical protein